MKRFGMLFVAVFLMATTVRAQYGAPDYDGYRTFDSFGRDTVNYLQYNWGWKTGGVYENTTLSEFFERFELDIKEVEIRCTTPGGIAEVGYIQFWVYPRNEALELCRRENKFGCRYSLRIVALLPTIDRHSMLYEDLKPHIPELKPNGLVVLPWKESYREALGPFIVGAIQYSYWRE